MPTRLLVTPLLLFAFTFAAAAAADARQAPSVSGRVTIHRHYGVSGIKMILTATSGPPLSPRWAVTAEDGTYTIPNVPTGRNYVLTASSGIFNFSPAAVPYTKVTTTRTNHYFALTSR